MTIPIYKDSVTTKWVVGAYRGMPAGTCALKVNGNYVSIYNVAGNAIIVASQLYSSYVNGSDVAYASVAAIEALDFFTTTA